MFRYNYFPSSILTYFRQSFISDLLHLDLRSWNLFSAQKWPKICGNGVQIRPSNKSSPVYDLDQPRRPVNLISDC